jgi:5-methylcytosine-specific restriction protein A
VPWARARACVVPLCPGLVTSPHAYRCPPHQAAYDATVDARRPSSSARGYGVGWARVRRAYLDAHPLCAMCGALSTDVDHIKAKRAGGSDHPSNLRALCHGCHSRRTGRDQPGGFGRP